MLCFKVSEKKRISAGIFVVSSCGDNLIPCSSYISDPPPSYISPMLNLFFIPECFSLLIEVEEVLVAGEEAPVEDEDRGVLQEVDHVEEEGVGVVAKGLSTLLTNWMLNWISIEK